jgi:hypothetical protein
MMLLLKEIGLARSQLKAVEKKVKRSGQTEPEYLRQLVERDLLEDQSIDEILRPIREDVRKKGLTEDDVDEIVERARNATSTTRRRNRKKEGR